MAGFAPRGRRELHRLLDVADLDLAAPSTLWHRADSGTWRTGIVGDEQPAWQAAAHAAGSVTAWRTFAAEDDDRAVEVQVVPLASVADAALATVADPARRWRRGDRHADEASPEAVTAGAFLVLAFASGAEWDASELAAILAAQVARLV